jgi:hypothetical protein
VAEKTTSMHSLRNKILNHVASGDGRRASNGMKIEICVPAFDEAQIIGEAARAVLQVFRTAGKEVSVTVSDNNR